MVVQVLAQRHGIQLAERLMSPDGDHPAAVYGDYTQDSHTVRLLLPLTMMNESGEALRVVNVPTDQVLVVCDDVNLPLGSIRLRPHGTAGGHHGLQSCLDVLQTELVPRLRVGVGAEPLPADLTQFVLSRFVSGERPLMKRTIEQAVDACEAWALTGITAAMNRFNRVEG